jgi:hypothetical protein
MLLQKVDRSYALDPQFAVGRDRQPIGIRRDARKRVGGRSVSVCVSSTCFVWHLSNLIEASRYRAAKALAISSLRAQVCDRYFDAVFGAKSR